MVHLIIIVGTVCAIPLIDHVHCQQCNPMSFHRLCMKDEGSTVILENEKLSLTISKATAAITNLHYNSHREPATSKVNLLQAGGAYQGYNVFISLNGTAIKGAVLHSCRMHIAQNSTTRIDLAFKQSDPKVFPVHFELHYVLEEGSPMFYYYSIHSYAHDMPDHYVADELRWALQTNDQVFKHYNVDGKRAGVFPTDEMFKDSQILEDWTYKFKDGNVYSKYQQISDNEGINSVFGVYDQQLGLSLIQTHKEWLSGGPFKQDLTTHPGGVPPKQAGSMILFHEHSGHYGTPALAPVKGWNKVYGPVAVYLSEGESPGAMYTDAERQLKEEEKKWPYQWVLADEYKAKGRGGVYGTLKVADGTRLEWADLVLTEPHVDDPDLETATYMYTGRTGPDGKIWIPAVRTGTYKLHIFAKGVVGKYIQNGIKVTAQKNTDLGNVTWHPETHGQLLWQLGIPDRKSGEFHVPAGRPSPVPNLEEFRKYGTWLSYHKEFPNDVDFTVGHSNPAKDWCYFMPMIRTPGWPDQLKEAGITMNATATNWKVRFDYKGGHTGKATLTLGVAAAVRGGISAIMNGHEVLKLDSFEGPKGDSALFRQAAHGIFRQIHASFDASLLKPGQNLMQLTPNGKVSANDFDRMLMWDYLRLEVN